MRYKAYTLSNYKNIPQISRLSPEEIEAIDVVGTVLPFKTNNYVVDNLINWDNVPNDPMFVLTFPQKDMLIPSHYYLMKKTLSETNTKETIKKVANEIRYQLNPQPAGQLDHNVPELYDEKLYGMQHKYRQTVLFFPSHGQTCHAYCTFCFRWPQFVGIDELKFASKEAEHLVEYVRIHPEVSDVLFTGGDPLIMKTRVLAEYIRPLLEANLPNLKNIRIGTKALGYWPNRFTTDSDASELLALFKDVRNAGKHLALMAHFNHPVELEGEAVQDAIRKIRKTGTIIRTQSPVLRHINNDPKVWAAMLTKQVELGCIPYYMFIARNTGAQHYFSISLIEAWRVFREAYQSVSGICRTLRGPSMSCMPGKVQMLGVSEIGDTKVMVFRMIQGRNPDWVARPFFAEYDEKATWYRDLKPAFGEEKFFFIDELNEILSPGELEPEYE